MCHPDVDPSPGAPELALELIDAYRVLGDSERRKLYDAELGLEPRLFDDAVAQAAAAPAEEAGCAETAPSVAAVEDDGRRDHDDPATGFEHAEAAEPAAVFDTLAPEFGSVAEAEVASAASPQASPDVDARERPWRRGWARAAVAGLSFAAGFVLLVFVVSNFRSSAERGITAIAVRPAAAAQRTPASVHRAVLAKAPPSPCYDLFNGLKGEQLYRECVKARVKLHLRMLRLPPASSQMEQDELQDAIAEIRQAVGAAGVHMASTQGFIEESIATFADVEKTAKDEQVRRIAENYFYYYDCEALKHCAR